MVSLIDISRQWFKARIGLPVAETHRDHAFCAYTILESTPDVMVVHDAKKDDRFCNNPLVLGYPFIRFYAGAPLIIEGLKVGTLCIIDSKPRKVFSEKDQQMLRDIAHIISDRLSERRCKLVDISKELAQVNLSVLSVIQRPLNEVIRKHQPLQDMMSTMQTTVSPLHLTPFLHSCLQFTEKLEILHDLMETSLHVVTRIFDIEQSKRPSPGFLPCSLHDLFQKVKNSLSRCNSEFTLDWYLNPYLDDKSLKLAVLQGKSPSQTRIAAATMHSTPSRSFVSHPDVLHLVMTSLLWDMLEEDRQMTNVSVACEEGQHVQLTEGQAFQLFHRPRAKIPEKIQTAWIQGNIIVTVNIKTSTTCAIDAQKEQAWQMKLLGIKNILSWVSGNFEKRPYSNPIDILMETDDDIHEQIVIKVPCMMEQEKLPIGGGTVRQFPVAQSTSPRPFPKGFTARSEGSNNSVSNRMLPTAANSYSMEEFDSLPQQNSLKPHVVDSFNEPIQSLLTSKPSIKNNSVRSVCKEIAIGMWRRVTTVHITDIKTTEDSSQ